jgi:hypothetical protein
MPRKRIAHRQRKPKVDPSLAGLAAVLEQIAAMDTLPQVPAHRSRKRKPCGVLLYYE